MIIRQLLDWWQLHFLENDSKARDDQSAESVFDGENYWNTVSLLFDLIVFFLFRETTNFML